MMQAAAKHRLLHNTVTEGQLVGGCWPEPCPGWAPELQDIMRNEAAAVVVEHQSASGERIRFTFTSEIPTETFGSGRPSSIGWHRRAVVV
jgi:hypothetical protein